MIWHRHTQIATPADYARMDHIRTLGCMCCALTGETSAKRVEIHHIKSGGKRMGHRFTIPLCSAHHRGAPGVISVHGSGMKAFCKAYGYTDLQLWQKLQIMLGLPDDPPPSKIFKREALPSETGVSHD